MARNIEVTVTNDKKVQLLIDPKVDLGPSSTGKTNLVASSGGYTIHAEGVRFNLTAIK